MYSFVELVHMAVKGKEGKTKYGEMAIRSVTEAWRAVFNNSPVEMVPLAVAWIERAWLTITRDFPDRITRDFPDRITPTARR